MKLKTLGIIVLVVLLLIAFFAIFLDQIFDFLVIDLLGGKKDCGSDLKCLEKYGNICRPAFSRIRWDFENVSGSVYFEIQGFTFSSITPLCVVYLKAESVPLAKALEGKDITCKLQNASVEAVNKQNCKGPLTDYLK